MTPLIMQLIIDLDIEKYYARVLIVQGAPQKS